MPTLSSLSLPPAQRRFLRIRSFVWFLRFAVLGVLFFLLLSLGVLRS
jgi:hypothetical protein